MQGGGHEIREQFISVSVRDVRDLGSAGRSKDRRVRARVERRAVFP
jgi:hypothetical protein